MTDPVIERLRNDIAYQREWGAVSGEDGRFLEMLVGMIGAKRVLEVGTGTGLAALFMGRALLKTGGKLTTLEIDPERLRRAQAHLQEAGLGETVDVRREDAWDALPRLRESFDMVFLDAVKIDSVHYLDMALPLVRRGGVIVAHDVNWGHGNTENHKMRDYLDALKTHPCLETNLVSDVSTELRGVTGAGMALSRKTCTHGECPPRPGRMLARSPVRRLPVQDASVAHTVLHEYVDDYDNPGYCLLVRRSTTKQEAVALCEQYLKRCGRRSTLLVHLYDSRKAFSYRNDLGSPPGPYFEHLVAQCRRHPRSSHDEIRCYRDAQVLLYEKSSA